MFRGMHMTQQKCLKHCSLFGRKDCHTFSIDSKNSSCTLYPKPCSKMNLTCTDCRTWTGKCRLPGSSTQNLISGTLLCYWQDLNNEPPNNRYHGKWLLVYSVVLNMEQMSVVTISEYLLRRRCCFRPK